MRGVLMSRLPLGFVMSGKFLEGLFGKVWGC